MDINIITSLSVILLSISLIILLIYHTVKKYDSVFVKTINYVIIIVGIYFLVSMFKDCLLYTSDAADE